MSVKTVRMSDVLPAYHSRGRLTPESQFANLELRAVNSSIEVAVCVDDRGPQHDWEWIVLSLSMENVRRLVDALSIQAVIARENIRAAPSTPSVPGTAIDYDLCTKCGERCDPPCWMPPPPAPVGEPGRCGTCDGAGFTEAPEPGAIRGTRPCPTCGGTGQAAQQPGGEVK